MKKSRRKIRRLKRKVVSLPLITYPTHEIQMCGFRINKEKHNRLWRWDTLEEVSGDGLRIV